MAAQNFADGKDPKIIETISAYLKSALVGIPTILYKTGSLAIMLSTSIGGAWLFMAVSVLLTFGLTVGLAVCQTSARRIEGMKGLAKMVYFSLYTTPAL